MIVYGGDSIESDYSKQAFNDLLPELKPYFGDIIGIDLNDLLNSSAIRSVLNEIDIAISIVYGNPGQEGEVQGIFELYKIPYIGSRIFACSLIKDKLLFKEFCTRYDFSSPKSICIEWNNQTELDAFYENIWTELNFPVVVKPRLRGGLSLGITYCTTLTEVKEAVKIASKYDEKILVEEFVDGMEVTACVINYKNDSTYCLPLIEVKKNAKILDYNTKITGYFKSINPVSITPKLEKRINAQVKDLFGKLQMRDWGYFDLIIKDDKIYFIEAGAVPGMTKGSNIPILVKYIGASLGSVIRDMVINVF